MNTNSEAWRQYSWLQMLAAVARRDAEPQPKHRHAPTMESMMVDGPLSMPRARARRQSHHNKRRGS